MSWTLAHPHDYFIAGVIIGVLFSVWVGLMVALFVQTRRSGSACTGNELTCLDLIRRNRNGVTRSGTDGLGESN